MTEFREGDVVSIEATVKYTPTGRESVFLDVEGHYNSISVKQANVKMVRPAFAIGERVIVNEGQGGAIKAIVLATAGNEVWIKPDEGVGYIANISDVRREPKPIAVEDEPCAAAPHYAVDAG